MLYTHLTVEMMQQGASCRIEAAVRYDNHIDLIRNIMLYTHLTVDMMQQGASCRTEAGVRYDSHIDLSVILCYILT